MQNFSPEDILELSDIKVVGCPPLVLGGICWRTEDGRDMPPALQVFTGSQDAQLTESQVREASGMLLKYADLICKYFPKDPIQEGK